MQFEYLIHFVVESPLSLPRRREEILFFPALHSPPDSLSLSVSRGETRRKSLKREIRIEIAAHERVELEPGKKNGELDVDAMEKESTKTNCALKIIL